MTTGRTTAPGQQEHGGVIEFFDKDEWLAAVQAFQRRRADILEVIS